MKDHIQIHSTVKAPLLRRALWQGSVASVMGLFMLVWGGAFLPLEKLAVWGLGIFTIGMALIIYGMVPYRRLSKLQGSPDRLIVDEENLTVISGGKTAFTIPLQSVKRCGHVDGEKDYGICLWFRNALPEKIWVHDPNVCMKQVTRKARRQHGCDMYLQYFSRRSYIQLAEIFEVED